MNAIVFFLFLCTLCVSYELSFFCMLLRLCFLSSSFLSSPFVVFFLRGKNPARDLTDFNLGGGGLNRSCLYEGGVVDIFVMVAVYE